MGIQLLPRENNRHYEISVIILCAGEGTRLKKITKKIPKSLIRIPALNNDTILQHLINNLIDLGIKQIILVIGHLGHKIEKFISNLIKINENYREKLKIIDSVNQYKLGPLYSFLSITKNGAVFNPHNIFLVIPGDTIFDFELLKEIYIKISENYDKIENFPIAFYKQIVKSQLKEKANYNYILGKKPISVVEVQTDSSNEYLKLIQQNDSEILGENEVVNQIIPIFLLNYNIILKFLNLKSKVSSNTLWELINYIIVQGEKVLLLKINTPYSFYDIDSKLDINNLKKK